MFLFLLSIFLPPPSPKCPKYFFPVILYSCYIITSRCLGSFCSFQKKIQVLELSRIYFLISKEITFRDLLQTFKELYKRDASVNLAFTIILEPCNVQRYTSIYPGNKVIIKCGLPTRDSNFLTISCPFVNYSNVAYTTDFVIL